MKNICVVTGSRAEYGLLKPLINKIKLDKNLNLQLIVTGMHLSSEFGLTYKEIEKDNFFIKDKIEVNLSSDTPSAICKSISLGIIGFSDSFNRLNPHIIIVLGDRYEILASCIAATIHNIPIAHINGGESTEGVMDEAIRHSITKMGYLHFTSTETYRNRVIQLGEDHSRVFNVGALGVENILNLRLLSKEELEKYIGFKFDSKVALLTYHSVTLDKENHYYEFNEILNALDEFENLKIIFTKGNSDTNGRIINDLIDKYVSTHKEKSISFKSMGQLNYLSAMKYSSFVIGNSSSGLIEAPTFNIPTINIGDRQRGRICPKSVINTNCKKQEIINAINTATSQDFLLTIKNNENIYGNGQTSYKILETIKHFLYENKINLKKSFYNIDVCKD